MLRAEVPDVRRARDPGLDWAFELLPGGGEECPGDGFVVRQPVGGPGLVFLRRVAVGVGIFESTLSPQVRRSSRAESPSKFGVRRRSTLTLQRSGTVEKPSPPAMAVTVRDGGCGNVPAAFGSSAPRSSSTSSEAFSIALVPRCVLEPECAATPATCIVARKKPRAPTPTAPRPGYPIITPATSGWRSRNARAPPKRPVCSSASKRTSRVPARGSAPAAQSATTWAKIAAPIFESAAPLPLR